MRIGVLARRAGVSASSIRFYEERGLLPRAPRLASGYRDYGVGDLAILAFIVRARGLGFGLADIAEHLSSPRDGMRKARLAGRLQGMIDEIDRTTLELAERRRTLATLVEETGRQGRDG